VYSMIGSLTETVTKGTTPTSVGHRFTDEGINFIKVESIDKEGCFRREKFAHIDDACHRALRRSQLQPGDILFSIAGALGRVAEVSDEILPANTNQALAIIRLKRDIPVSSRYLIYALTSKALSEQIEKGRGGVAQQNLSLSQIRQFSVPLPPLSEQKRIVAILDEAFAGIATAVANTEKNLANARELFESYLNAVIGRSGDDWITKTLDEICLIARGGSPRPIKGFLTDDPEGVNWVKISDATASSKYIYETKQKIRREGVRRSRMVHEGDLLLSNSMSFGRPYIMKTSGCVHDGWLVLSDKSGSYDQEYLYYYLGSSDAYRQFDSRASGSTVRNLNIDLVRTVHVPLPSLHAQREIVGALEDLRAECERLVSIYKHKLDSFLELKQALLQKALSGELTAMPQHEIENALA
jgi:type I restriction enzyme S subunit